MTDELPTRVIMQQGGRIVIPGPMRKELQLKEGSVLELKREGKKAILITVLVA
jgi:AbrB family looped-hinge helix DNA binding protein